MLVIHIEGAGARASDVAAILAAADKSFSRFGREWFGGLKPVLTVEAVKPGSVDIVLGVLDIYDAVKNATALLGPFAGHLASVIELIRAGAGGQVNPTDRKFVRSIVEPVANDHALQINFVNNGSIAVTINGGNAGDLMRGLDEIATVSRAVAPRLPAGPARLSPSQARQLEETGLEGTAMAVEAVWYARLLFGHGVLVPVTGAVAGLEHNRKYRFIGRPLTGERGEVIGIYVTAVEPI